MRVMVFVKATGDSEKGHAPEPWTSEMMAAMGRFNDELRAAGLLVMADGLKPWELKIGEEGDEGI